MRSITDLSPRGVWEIFDEITRVPRPSKKEGKIVAWLVEFAEKHGLAYRRDEIGNVVILGPASPGMESAPTVVLQNHVDMVCEKNAGAKNAAGGDFDFERDGIQTYVDDDGWVRARGTTLGADNGLGMAAVLALLIDKTAVHGPLEALFTVDEETGLTGAFNLGKGKVEGSGVPGYNNGEGTSSAHELPQMITGKYLINLDSEDEGEVFIGCAGGVDTLAYFDFTWVTAPAGCEFYELTVSGLKGGHSGDDIEKGRGNSNNILARALFGAGLASSSGSGAATGAGSGGSTQPAAGVVSDLPAHESTVGSPHPPTGGAEDSCGVRSFDLRLASIDGGNLRNAIPREARAVVGIPVAKVGDFKAFVGAFAADVHAELLHSDPGVEVAVKPAGAVAKVMDADTTRRLVRALIGVPNGVQAMSFAMPGLVETSTNLASVKVVGGVDAATGTAVGTDGHAGRIVVTTSQRSSVESAKRATAAAVESVFALAGARVEHSEGYPGWAPDPSSHLLEVTRGAYTKLFGKEIKVRAIHAGLECGLFLERFPGLDMVSFGPTILGAHSPDERIEIATVDKFWRLLLAVLADLRQ